MATVEEMLEAQRATIEKNQRRLGARQRRIINSALQDMLREIRGLRPGSWSAYSNQAVMLRLGQAVIDMITLQKKDVGDQTRSVVKDSARLTAQWLTELEQRHKGAVRPLRFDTLEWWTRKSTDVNRARLRMYSESFRRYGARTVTQIEDAIAQAVLLGEPWSTARPKVWAATRRVVGDNQWMVDRIIRTEVSAVHNAAALEALREEDTDPEDPMEKVLVATFDAVTGQDSRFVHGQRRKLDEPFQDDKGRLYMAPPNRPNDREIVAGWRRSYGPFDPGRKPKLAVKRSKARPRPKPAPKPMSPQAEHLDVLRAVNTAEIESIRRSLVPPIAISGTPQQIAAQVDFNFAAQQRIRRLQAERKQLAEALAKVRAAEAKRVTPAKPEPRGKPTRPKVAPKDKATDRLRKEIDGFARDRKRLLNAAGKTLGKDAAAELRMLDGREAALTKGKRGVTPRGRVVRDIYSSQAQRDVWVASLTEAERKAVYDWSTEDWYKEMRMVDSGRAWAGDMVGTIRAVGSSAKDARFVIEARRRLADFRSALAKAPRYQGTVLRGLRDLPKDSALRKALDTEGAIIELDAVSSWSADAWEARGFAADGEGSYLLQVKTKRGAVISDSRVVNVAAEAEVMLDRGARFRVKTSKLREGDEYRRLVILEEIDPA